MNHHIFRENDIRGLVGTDLSEETVGVLARAIGTFFRQNDVQRVSLGFDARESSPQANDVAAKYFRHREQIVGQSCRLCRLRVGIGGHD